MLYNMYLFNAWLNKYEHVKHCIIVAYTYAHGVISLLLSLFYCWVTRLPVEATPPKPSWWPHAHAWELLHLCPSGIMHWRQPGACAQPLPAAWRLYVGVARPFPAFQKQATASQGHQCWHAVSAGGTLDLICIATRITLWLAFVNKILWTVLWY